MPAHSTSARQEHASSTSNVAATASPGLSLFGTVSTLKNLVTPTTPLEEQEVTDENDVGDDDLSYDGEDDEITSEDSVEEIFPLAH